MSRAVVFPGQGSQVIGMGRALYDAFPVAKAVFDEVDDALSQKLSALIFNGTDEALRRTAITQPALMVVSLAVCRVLEQEGGWPICRNVSFAAGHSLGEYSALCATGALTLADTARLLRIRGEAMQAAVPEGEGAMAAILGAAPEAIETLLKATRGADICVIANDNCEGQIVISGTVGAVQRAINAAGTQGIKRCVQLPVSAPFHCPLMAPAAVQMAEALATIALQAPCVPVVSNVTAQAVQDPDAIRKLLVEQITQPVLWKNCVHTMLEAGVTTFIEIGSGQVLTGLIKRIAPDAQRINLLSPESLEAFLKNPS